MDSNSDWQRTTQSIISHAEQAFSERTALLAVGRISLTYGQLGVFCRGMQEQLRAHGFGPESRIAVALSGGAEMAAAFLAVASCAVCVPLAPGSPEAEAIGRLTQAGAQTVMIENGAASGIRAAAAGLGLPVIGVTVDSSALAGVFTCEVPMAGPPLSCEPPDPEATALLLPTSGTTGEGKLVHLTHGNICSSACQMALTLRLQTDDVSLNIMPLTHIAALGNVVLASVAAGAGIVCTDSFRPAQFFELMEEFSPTWYTASPAMHRAILDIAPSARDIISTHPLRFIGTFAAACPVELADELEGCFGVPLVHHGLTETGQLIAANPLLTDAGVEAIGPEDDRIGCLQEILLGILRKVLGVAKAGLDDDFLDLGGDSLGATRFIAQVQAVLGCSLGYVELFDHATVRSLAGLLTDRVSALPDPPATS